MEDKKNKILIIEDELEFAEMVRVRLELLGYKVSIALDALTGTREILQNDFDLVILDLMMPAGGGFSVLQRMRKTPFKSLIPVIILTAKDITPEIRNTARIFKVSTIFQKPYDEVEFEKKVKELLPI